MKEKYRKQITLVVYGNNLNTPNHEVRREFNNYLNLQLLNFQCNDYIEMKKDGKDRNGKIMVFGEEFLKFVAPGQDYESKMVQLSMAARKTFPACEVKCTFEMTRVWTDLQTVSD